MIDKYPEIKYTDYPFIELGDESGKEAPIRECYLLSCDQDKYCDIKLIESGLITNIKRCYVYDRKRRLHE